MLTIAPPPKFQHGGDLIFQPIEDAVAVNVHSFASHRVDN